MHALPYLDIPSLLLNGLGSTSAKEFPVDQGYEKGRQKWKHQLACFRGRYYKTRILDIMVLEVQELGAAVLQRCH